MRALRSAACSFWLFEPWSPTRMPNVVCPADVTALIVNHACFPIVVSDPTILTLATAYSKSPAIGLENAMPFAQARLSGRLPLVPNSAARRAQRARAGLHGKPRHTEERAGRWECATEPTRGWRVAVFGAKLCRPWPSSRTPACGEPRYSPNGSRHGGDPKHSSA